MPSRLADVLLIAAAAGAITLWLALPVLRAPAERVFGAEIVGRHHDPYTVMQQLERPINFGVYAQPVTDIPGALLARVVGGVAAYNWLVLLSFPLTAVAGYLLARHLLLSKAGATVAALACAFSPFHLAHAAYHPHIAQIQWLPLYLLALWRCLDSATIGAAATLVAAVAGVALSNYYGGLIAAVITPVAVAAYWLAIRRGELARLRTLAITMTTAGLCAVAGGTYVWWAAGGNADRDGLGFARADLFHYGARWWSYLVPPVEHPVLGSTVARFWTNAGEHKGLLEQQVSLGWGVMALAVAAIAAWWRDARPVGAIARVPVLIAVALVALACSLAPDPVGAIGAIHPSSVIYDFLPMFRSYARFGVMVQLMAALLAGIGVDLLVRSRDWRARTACATLVLMAAAEYAVLPSAQWRDVLPTTAHRWVMQQPLPIRVVDCVPPSEESASMPWLTGNRVTHLNAAIADCAEPHLSHKLAAMDYTHLLKRQGREGPRPTPPGMQVAAVFPDAAVYAVASAGPALYTGAMTGFSPREHDDDWSWRWMETEGSWIVMNTTAGPVRATLDLEASSFARNRSMTVWLDGREVQSVAVSPDRQTHRIGPVTYSPGSHNLVFRAAEPPTVADAVLHNGDRRPLSVAIGTWTWLTIGDEP